MNEYRRAKRKHADEAIDVFDCMTEQSIGRIGNLSESGAMLICPQPLFEDALYQLRFSIRDSTGRERSVEVGAHHLWSDEAGSPGQHWCGLRFIDVTKDHLQIMRDWVETPGESYA
ncbi:MAG: PilZ domain-containing protein [Xanthomonadales bacterium]|nr:PilZ domain-containing protein [Xanthomonadales bacterium]